MVYLPANPAAGVNPIKPEEDLIKGYGKVLVVDDEEFILDVANQMLRTLGYQATTSIFGTDAVTKYKTSIESGNRFNVVITDLTIPGDISGVEVLKRIQEIDSEAKVIVSSGYAERLPDFRN